MHTYDTFDTSMIFPFIKRGDYNEQAASDISAPSFHINARYMLIIGQRMPDLLEV